MRGTCLKMTYRAKIMFFASQLFFKRNSADAPRRVTCSNRCSMTLLLLDREILERAFYSAWTTVKETERSVALDEERLAAVLRSKLIEIAQANGPSDAEALRDMLLDRRPASEP